MEKIPEDSGAETLPLKFSFPADKDKEPLVGFTVSCGKKDYEQLNRSVMFGGSKAGLLIAAVLGGLFLAQIIFAAFMSGEYLAGTAYTVFGALVIIAYISPKISAGRLSKLAPNDSSYFVYSFYRHHFTFVSEYEGLSLSYDDLFSALENSLVFILYGNDGSAKIIPKRELEKENSAMLHAVLENKLGSKFTVKFL